MQATHQATEHKSFERPDETRELPNGQAQIVSIGGAEVGRRVFEPSWRWSTDWYGASNYAKAS